MPPAAYYPTYRLKTLALFSILLSALVGKCRNFSADARGLIKGITPSPVFKNPLHVPPAGPLLITLNHYSRPGFMVFWAASALSAVLPQPPIWMMTSAWTDRSKGFDQLRTWLTRRLFIRLAGIYSFVTTPPMPPVPQEVNERAASIRRLMRRLSEQPNPVLCLAPEGMDFPAGVLGFPPDGTGKFILHLSKDLKRILPVGVYEEDGELILNFGKPYTLDSKYLVGRDDKEISALVMKAIAALLPARLRGQFSEVRD